MIMPLKELNAPTTSVGMDFQTDIETQAAVRLIQKATLKNHENSILV